MSFKKTLALCLSLLILGGCAITGTLAFPNLPSFLTSLTSEGDGGESTPPKVEITLNIEEDAGVKMFPGKPLKKIVTITNSSTSPEPVYVWYTYTVPKALVQPVKTGGALPLVGSFAKGTKWIYQQPGKENGNVVEFTCLYGEALEPGKTTEPSLESVTLDVHIDHDPDGTFLWWEDGECTTIDYSGETVKMHFKARAISKAQFADVYQAYDTYVPDLEQTATAEVIAE